MKAVLLVFALLAFPLATHAQAFSSNRQVLTVHSQNGSFYLRSIPFDTEFPTMRGVTRVYASGRSEPLYEFERGFDSVERDSNNLILSNDGETIFYAIPWRADEETEGLKSITVYRHGRIHRSFTEADIHGCDKREHCALIYSNYAQVVDREKSGEWPNYKRVFKNGVPEEEIFLNDFALFSNGDTVYLTDSRKRTHLFDLSEGVLTRSASFEDLYDTMKGLGRFTRVEVESYRSPELTEFSALDRLANGDDTEKSLAAHLGMKVVDMGNWNRNYKLYAIVIRGYLLRGGSFELESVEGDEGLPRDRIVEFFAASRFRFDETGLPAEFEKIHVGEQRFYLRNSDNTLARRERQAQLEEEERFERGASAVLHEKNLIHLDHNGNVRVWHLQDGSFDAAASAEFSGNDLTHLAADDKQLWSVGKSEVYRWSAQERTWISAAKVNQKRDPIFGFAVVNGEPLLVLATEVLNPVTRRRYQPPMPGSGLLESTGSLSDTVAVLGTESQLWIGTTGGEWGGRLYGLNPASRRWTQSISVGGNVTGITQAGPADLIVSWAMSHFETHTRIRRHGPDGKVSREYPVLEAQYYQTVAFNPFDNKLYGVEQRDVVTISDGSPTTIAELDGPVFRKERHALGVAPGIAKLLPFAPSALIVVPKIGMPWMLREGQITRLTEPGEVAQP